jgi:glyoxylase I family protein
MANDIIKGLKFTHAAVKVSDLDASVRFYEKLGFKVFASWGEGDGRAVLLDIGGGEYIELFAGGKKAGATDGSAAGHWQHIALTPDSIDDAYNTAIAAGAKSQIAPKDVPLASSPKPMTLRIAFVEGPDGEVIEFFKIIG